ncbi:MAG: NUDIX domain-containing protein [Pseudolabrys sp.]
MDEIADRAADVTVEKPELLAKGFRDYRRYRLSLTGEDGGHRVQTRDMIDGGKVVAVLPVDLARDEIVLIRQFRLPAHLGNGKGDLVEVVAGRVEPGEALAATAKRECAEEIGVEPTAIAELFSYFTTPGLTDEEVTVFLAAIDASRVPERTEMGGEMIHTLRVPIDAALESLARNTIRNGPALLALQWLALNRASLQALLRG